MNWFTQPIELPAGVQRLLPKSFVRALASAVIIALWLRPNLDASMYLGPPGDGVAAWQLRGIFPANLSVPLTALILLVSAWRGYRRLELVSILVLWLHAMVIATLVPLGSTSGDGGIVLALYAAMVSGLRSALLGRPSSDGPQTVDSAQLQSEVRRTIILGFGVALLALILLFPVILSHGATSRETNLVYATVSRVFGSSMPAGPARFFPASPAPTVAQQGSNLGAPRASVPAQHMATDQDNQIVNFTVAQRCQFGGKIPDNLISSTTAAWSEAVNSTSASKAQIARTRQRLFQAFVDAHFDAYASSWLSITLPNLQSDAASSGLLTTMLPWDVELSASPDIGWTRPIVAQVVTRYSTKRAESLRADSHTPAAESRPADSHTRDVGSRPADSPAPAGESAGEEAESDEPPAESVTQHGSHVFPIDIECSMAGTPAEIPGAWLYPMAGTTSGVPQLEMEQADGRLLVKLPLASIERAASIVDFARFIGADVSVTLAHREASEIAPGEPDQPWEGLSWGIEVTTDLPALVIAGDKLIHGRLVGAHGDDPCVSESSIDILMEHSPEAPITGLVLLANNDLAERVAVLSVKSTQSTHDVLRSSRTVTLVDVTGDRQADLSFESVRYEVRAGAQNDDAHWIAGPWSWVGVASSQSADAPFDRVTYPGCPRGHPGSGVPVSRLARDRALTSGDVNPVAGDPE
jgi:hypothetical protein